MAKAPPLPSDCCSMCRSKPCRLLCHSGTQFKILFNEYETPKACPALLKNQGHREKLMLAGDIGRLSKEHIDDFMQAFRRIGSPLERHPESSQEKTKYLEKQFEIHSGLVLHFPYFSEMKKRMENYQRAKFQVDHEVQIKRKLENDPAWQAAEAKKKLPSSLHNAEFIHIEDDKKPGSPEHIISEASIAEIVYLRVESENLMPSDEIQFNLYRKGLNGAPDKLIEVLTGLVGKSRKDECAVARWFIPDQNHGEKFTPEVDQFFFEAKFAKKNLAVKSSPLKLEDDFDEDIFYSPVSDEYLILPPCEEAERFFFLQ